MRHVSLYLLSLIPSLALANLDLITWKAAYYHPMPNQKGISQAYCNAHNPGIFIHVVKEALEHPVYTNRGIKMDRAHLTIKEEHGVYLLQGDFWASGTYHGKAWEDHNY